jgi:AraC family transcriptional regulator of adaptative response/methylated-DNA-[protein]-cysteine methyltransferase
MFGPGALCSDKEPEMFMTDSRYAVEQERWDAVVRRDRAADGAFLYAVTTTGIYCRPGCSSRLPNRDNVRFFDTYVAAEQAGYRPCKRCAPPKPHGFDAYHDAVVAACERINAAEKAPSLQELARDAGISASHFQRVFKAATGVSPKQYALARRAERVKAQLLSGETVTEALYNAGYGASSRLYEESGEVLGMTPGAFRDGARGQAIRYAEAPCYLGRVLVAATERGICAIELGDRREQLVDRLHERFPKAKIEPAEPELAGWLAQVVALLDAPQRGLDLPLDIQGTAFQRRVWEALRAIPAGTRASYGDVARAIGQPGAVRAVAQACAANPVAVAIPCHRIVRSDGSLSGYRWGTERKRALLAREAEAL